MRTARNSLPEARGAALQWSQMTGTDRSRLYKQDVLASREGKLENCTFVRGVEKARQRQL
jgi:hypothetical protein